MKLVDILPVIQSIKGCTFASLDALTVPSPGIKKVTTGESIILFGGGKASGYDAMVRRRLAAIGRNPDNFVLSDLPWGERLKDTPIIQHAGQDYLQTVLLSPGTAKYYIGTAEVDPWMAGLKPSRPNQGLGGNSVVVNTYKLSSITALRLLGETLT